MSNPTEILACVSLAIASVVGVAALCWRRTGSRVRDEAKLLENRIEMLNDEVWELKEAAVARARAEAASEAKSRFLATVSHEIRTPLNGIVGMADLLVETRLDGEQKSYVEAVRSSGRALASLIDEILDFSRIEAGKLDLASEPFEVAALVEGVVELLAPKAQGKGLEIAASVAADVPRSLYGDVARLRQVLLNLAGNAVKFTEAGGVGVRVTKVGNGNVRFAVSDTGPGVPEAHRASIFSDFEQGDGSASRRHEGTGLGLAISRRIVERMGGSLTLQSVNGQGALFVVEVGLPECEPARSGEPPTLNGRLALIVGKSPFEAPYLAERLASAGARTIRAESLESALGVLGEAPTPDVVIVDCALGETVTRRIAEAARAAGVARSLVLFSPFERRVLGRASLEGFDGWLVKPVRSKSLISTVVEHRVSASGNASPDTSNPPGRPLEGLRILVAEDNEINAFLAQRQLARLGADAIHARDGAQAVELALAAMSRGGDPFDVILMDIRMPGLDGLEATRRIRLAECQENTPRTRIVALSANAFEEDRRAAAAAGIDEFLTKPIDVALLSRALLGETLDVRKSNLEKSA
jgi:signal transduction histidine kinase/CheY-like chemotaxis protein